MYLDDDVFEQKVSPSKKEGNKHNSTMKETKSIFSKFGGDGKSKHKLKPKSISVDDAGLPPAVREEIHKFKLEGFAEEHFRVCKKRVGLSMRKVPVEDLLTFQTEPLTAPLLKSCSNADSQLAVKCFSNICKFIGVLETSKPPAFHSKSIIDAGMEKPALIDEIYCQLFKQIRKNPNLRSVASCWKLFLLCTCHFAPTREFEGYVLSYMSRSAKETVSSTTEILNLIVFAIWRLTRTIRYAPMKGTLTLEDIDKIAADGISFPMVTFGSSISFILKCQEINDIDSSDLIPIALKVLITKCRDLKGLEIEGIFRRTGDRSEIDRLITEIEKGRLEDLKCDDPLVVADLIKIWFRELFPRVFPASFSAIAEKLASSNSHPELCFAALEQLPEENRAVVLYLLSFCAEVVQNVAKTSMGAENIGIVFGPNMFTDPEGGKVELSALFTGSNSKNLFVSNLIRAYMASR